MTVEKQIRELKGNLLISEAAMMLGVSEQTLRNWDASGRLVPLRHPITGYRYYREEDLKDFLKTATQKRSR